MALAPLLLVFLVCCSGCLAQTALTQPPSVSVSPGQTATLTCTGKKIGNYGAAWYQVKPGSGPRLVVNNERDRSPGVSERFSNSKSGDTATLTITGVRAEDEAEYVCGAYGDTGTFVFGGGTQLTVLGQPKASPTVHLFPPSSEELSSQSKATLVCLMDNFYPGSVQVTWKADGAPITSGVETTKPSKQSNNQYMASSYLKLSASEWKSHESYTCLVTHDGKSTDKTLKRSECS